MSRQVFVLRPEPGGAETAARLRGMSLEAVQLPLFAVKALRWDTPDPAQFDALILTSANAVRHGGPGIGRLVTLPVYAVGAATASASRAAGLDVVAIGHSGAAALIATAQAQGVTRALHLCGRDRTNVADGAVVSERIAVYASAARAVTHQAIAAIEGAVVLTHSVRAAARLSVLVERHGVRREAVRLGAISPAVAAAAGDGWDQVAVAGSVDDAALIAIARTLAD